MLSKPKSIILGLFIIFFSTLVNADEIDLEKFAQTYFNTMVATQAPNATKVDLENYFSLLTDDVGHSHLPWVTDDSRLPDGKEAMRKGMLFYLGAHTEFSAELLDVFIFNSSAVAIRYKKSAKGIHPHSKEPIVYTRTFMEVLEMENGKVAIIRKYHE
ncbi:nuclear transport factor 2 family protein [Pseudoalteromonas tetraodonis]|uniref:nuclear transport factor 2 family protein n=1 Tax=Pseudoalteromonas tetraodonis TaxID=43659 RepID=UPI003A96A79B